MGRTPASRVVAAVSASGGDGSLTGPGWVMGASHKACHCCGLVVAKGSLAEHGSECRGAKLCYGCGAVVQNRNLEVHLQLRCPMRRRVRHQKKTLPSAGSAGASGDDNASTGCYARSSGRRHSVTSISSESTVGSHGSGYRHRRRAPRARDSRRSAKPIMPQTAGAEGFSLTDTEFPPLGSAR